MLNTLRRRLIISHTLSLLIVVPLTGLALIYVLETRTLLPGISQQLHEEALLVVQMTRDQPELWSNPGEAQVLVDKIDVDLSALVMLLDRNGHILATSDPNEASLIGQTLDHPALASILAGQISEHTDYTPNLDAQAADIFIPVMGPDQKVVGVVRLAHRLRTIYDQFLRVRYTVMGILGLALILGTLGGLVLSMNLERPLREVALAINRLASGQDLMPLPERSPEEIRLVQHAFNVLMKRLHSVQQSQQQLLANTVHELSTPLGALNSGVQALQEGADEDVELRRELLRGMKGEVRRLEHLLEDLTHLYDQVLGRVELERRTIVLGQWLGGVLATWREAALDKGLKWQANISPHLPQVQADPDRLAQIIGNLLSNAIKYTDKGGTLSVSARPDKNGVSISVMDTGQGIPPDEQSKIFAPFFRGRHAGRFPEGMGLGLPIARELAAAHGGRLEVQSTPGSGSCFTLWLPLQ